MQGVRELSNYRFVKVSSKAEMGEVGRVRIDCLIGRVADEVGERCGEVAYSG